MDEECELDIPSPRPVDDTAALLPVASSASPGGTSECVESCKDDATDLNGTSAEADPIEQCVEDIVMSSLVKQFFDNLDKETDELRELEETLETDITEKQRKLKNLQNRVAHETGKALENLKKSSKIRDFLKACTEEKFIERTEEKIKDLEAALEHLKEEMATRDLEMEKYLAQREKQLDEVYDLRRNEVKRKLLERIQQLGYATEQERLSFAEQKIAESNRFDGAVSQLRTTLTSLQQEEQTLKAEVEALEKQLLDLRQPRRDAGSAREKDQHWRPRKAAHTLFPSIAALRQ